MTTTTAELQRRTLRVLVVAQVLSGAGLAAGVTVGALLAQDMLGSTGLAGLPAALLTAGSAATAVAIGRISQSGGRRPGLATGYAVGALGSAGVVLAAVLDSPALLFVALFVYGAGSATNLQARYAGADLAEVDHRARAISTVLVATTLGGVVGPLLAAPTGDLAHLVGIPHLAGPFLLAGVAYLAAAVVLAARLRPDPLLHARELASSELASSEPALTEATPAPVPETRASQVRHGILVGTTVMVLTQAVMVAIMTMTPVHMHDHGHGTAAAGAVIALHVAAMYLPSPVTGRLVDRVGRTPMAIASGATLLVAGVLAAVAPDDSVVLLALALALLGLGWNFGLVSGTAIVTDAVPLETRARTQGWVDVSIAIAGAGGGLMSGVVVEMTSYSVLSFAGGLLALAILPAVAAAAGPRPPLAAA
jgi:MFS family permease